MKKDKQYWDDPYGYYYHPPEEEEEEGFFSLWKQASGKERLTAIGHTLAVALMVVIYNGGAILGWYGHIRDALWFPYVFLGIPSFTVAGHFKHYNQIWVFWEATKYMLWANPLFTIMFYVMLFILYQQFKKFEKVGVLYVLTIFVELILIFSTDWSV